MVHKTSLPLFQWLKTQPEAFVRMAEGIRVRIPCDILIIFINRASRPVVIPIFAVSLLIIHGNHCKVAL